jgi:hypothetical protein
MIEATAITHPTQKVTTREIDLTISDHLTPFFHAFRFLCTATMSGIGGRLAAWFANEVLAKTVRAIPMPHA